MKLNFLLLLFFSTACMAFISEPQNARFMLVVKETGIDKRSPNFKYVVIELKNLTSDTLTFISDECDLGNIIISGKGVERGMKCKARLPAFIKIAGHDSFQLKVGAKNISGDSIFPVFQVGVNLTEPTEKYVAWKAYEARKSYNTITLWADPIR